MCPKGPGCFHYVVNVLLIHDFGEAGDECRQVCHVVTAAPQLKAVSEYEDMFGADQARAQHLTHLVAVDVSTIELVHTDRFQDLDYVVQVGRLKALHEKFRPSLIISERNSMGELQLELLYIEDFPVSGFQTKNQSKAKVIEAQVLAFEREKLKIINEPVLIEELQAYELERMPGGLIRYQTPQGLHDNTLISAALSWYAVDRIGPVVLW